MSITCSWIYRHFTRAICFSCAAVLLHNFFRLDSRITKANRRLNCVLQLHNVFAQILLLLFNFNQLTHLNALFSNPIEMKYSGDVRMNHFYSCLSMK